MPTALREMQQVRLGLPGGPEGWPDPERGPAVPRVVVGCTTVSSGTKSQRVKLPGSPWEMLVQ